MSLRALKTALTVLSLVACANEVQEIGAPENPTGGSGSGATGGDDTSGGSAGSSAGTSSSGATGGSSAGGSGQSGAFGGSAGVGSGGTSGGTGGSAGDGAGGTAGSEGGTAGGGAGGAGGASGAGGSGGAGPIGECADLIEWVPGAQLTQPLNMGDKLTFNNKVFTYAGNMPLWNFEMQCPPEGTRQPWCEQDSSIYKYTLVGPCE